MMFVETDMFIMTTPDLNTYYLKRSFIKKISNTFISRTTP